MPRLRVAPGPSSQNNARRVERNNHVKSCSKCKIERPIEDFSFKRGDRRDSQCKYCKRVSIKAAYDRNKGPYIERAKACNARRRIEFREFVNGLKSKPCQDCGRTYPPCVMDYDHRPGTIKSKAVSLLAGLASSMNGLLAEIEKCDLVCANCHRIRTHSRRSGKRMAQ